MKYWKKSNGENRTHIVRRRAAEESNFSCKCRKAKTYQVFLFPEADVSKCQKVMDSWSVWQINSKPILNMVSYHYGYIKYNQAHKLRTIFKPSA